MEQTSSNTSTVKTYTLMPDFCSAYGWILMGAPESGAGVGKACDIFKLRRMGHPVPSKLQRAIENWQREFEEGRFSGGYVELDWVRFHKQGIELAKSLKTVLGDSFRIIYEKPCEDPGQRKDERREVLSNGTVIGQPSRIEVYRQAKARQAMSAASDILSN